jgi:hypothetical protein
VRGRDRVDTLREVSKLTGRVFSNSGDTLSLAVRRATFAGGEHSFADGSQVRVLRANVASIAALAPPTHGRSIAGPIIIFLGILTLVVAATWKSIPD